MEEIKDWSARDLEVIPFDKMFEVSNGNQEFCHSTGIEVFINGQWWNEYIDGEGNLHYGR